MKLVDSTRPGELLVWGSAEEHLCSAGPRTTGFGDTNTESELRRYDLNKAELAQFTLLKPEIDKRSHRCKSYWIQRVKDCGPGVTPNSIRSYKVHLASLRKPGPDP